MRAAIPSNSQSDMAATYLSYSAVPFSSLRQEDFLVLTLLLVGEAVVVVNDSPCPHWQQLLTFVFPSSVVATISSSLSIFLFLPLPPKFVGKLTVKSFVCLLVFNISSVLFFLLFYSVGRGGIGGKPKKPTTARGIDIAKATGAMTTEKRYGAGGNASAHSGGIMSAKKVRFRHFRHFRFSLRIMGEIK